MSWTQELFIALAEVGPHNLLHIGPLAECAEGLQKLCRKNKRSLTRLEPFRQKKNAYLLLREALLAHGVVCIHADQDRSELFELLLLCEECLQEQCIHPVFSLCNVAESTLDAVAAAFLEHTRYECYIHREMEIALMVSLATLAERKGLAAHLREPGWKQHVPGPQKEDGTWALQKAEARLRFLQSMREKEILDFGWAWEVARRGQGVSRGDWEILEKAHENLQKKTCALQNERDWLRASQERLQHDIGRMLQSKSWKLTAPLRKAEAWLRRHPREQPEATSGKYIAQTPFPQKQEQSVAVIIPCHNYGCFLAECIESVLRQTRRAEEIIVVDDASEDGTPNIAKEFAGRGVRYLRGEWRDVCKARNAGAASASASFLIFLDADDSLAPDYIEQCLVKMHDPTVAIAYGFPLRFGERNHLVHVPEFDREKLLQRNYISSHAMIRRQAFDMVGGYVSRHFTHQDWDLYRHILQLPWKAALANTHVLYRAHSGSNFYRSLQTEGWQYCQRACLQHHPVSIFTLFTGRNELLGQFVDALRALDFDQKLLQLHCFDISGNAAFGQQLRNILAPLVFGYMAYSNATVPENREQAPEDTGNHTMDNAQTSPYRSDLAITYAYNQFLKTCGTEFVLVIAEDVCPAPDVLKTLLDTIEEDVVAVAAPCLSRTQEYWGIWNTDPADKKTHLKTLGKGTEEIGGSEFGCVLFRMSALKKVSISTGARWNPEQRYDRLVFDQLWNQGRVLCNWDARAERVYTGHCQACGGKAQNASS